MCVRVCKYMLWGCVCSINAHQYSFVFSQRFIGDAKGRVCALEIVQVQWEKTASGGSYIRIPCIRNRTHHTHTNVHFYIHARYVCNKCANARVISAHACKEEYLRQELVPYTSVLILFFFFFLLSNCCLFW